MRDTCSSLTAGCTDMATLLAETIMQTIQSTLVAGVSATVFRGRVDPLEDSQLPAIAIFQGAEEPAGELGQLNNAYMDQLLQVRTEVAAKAIQENVETDLNDLRRQVHALLLAPNALNLAYVIDIIPDGVDEPVIDGSGEQYTGTMVIKWIIYYRHQYTDAGAAP